MHNKLSVMFVIGLMVSIGLLSCMTSESNAEQSWLPGFTYSPNPAYYKETITFTGTVGCPDPVYWNWTFAPGSVKKYGNPVTYSWAPNWQNTSYQVSLTVTNSTGASGGISKSVNVKIAFDLWNHATAAPTWAGEGDSITITVEAHNEGNHICPAGYKLKVDIVKGIFNTLVASLPDITGPYDISPGGAYPGLTSTWSSAHPAGIYRARVTLDSTTSAFDTDKTDNVEYSNWFTIHN